MNARPIGDFIAPILEKTKSMMNVQWLLSLCDRPCDKKNLIVDLRQRGLLNAYDTAMLISVYALEEV